MNVGNVVNHLLLTAGNRDQHVKVVHDCVRDHKCNVCGQGFSNVSHRNQHVKEVHEEARDHKCKVCGQRFSRAWYRNQHVLHTIVCHYSMSLNER